MVHASVIARFHPALLIPLFVVKKLSIFKAAQLYGFPRVYRRLAEGIRDIVPVSEQAAVRSAIKNSMRFPNTAVNLVENSNVVNFITKYCKIVIDKSPYNLPPFFLSLAKQVVAENPVVRMWNMLRK